MVRLLEVVVLLCPLGRVALNARTRGPPLSLLSFTTREVTQEEHMKKRGLFCLTLNTVLLTATPTRAAIHAILENPPNVQVVGDITTVQAVGGIAGISGWAFPTPPTPAVTL